MGFLIGILKRIIKLFLCFTILFAVVVLIPNLPPYSTFTSIPPDPVKPRVGPLAPNGDLNNAQKLYTDKLLGPEAFQIHNGELYTSLATGEIVKISPGGHVTFVTKIGQHCLGLVQEHICGRPLGFEIDEKTNQMYVADAYHGIWQVDIKTDKKKLLVSPNVAINGRQPKLFNFVALAKNGDIYWTDSTSEFYLKDAASSVLTDPSGRLLQYNPAKNESKVLIDDLWFPNGLAISPDNEFVVVAETFRYRLVKYYINGPNKGKSEVFVNGLPGTPDNIRTLPDGSGVLVALFKAFDDEYPMIMRSLSETPIIRKFLARLQRLIEIPLEFLSNTFPGLLFDEMVYYIGHFKSTLPLLPPIAGLVQIDWKGNIVGSYYNTDESLTAISDAIVYDGKLLIGSPHVQNYIGAVPIPSLLKKPFENIIKTDQGKPVLTQPKIQEKPKTVKTPEQKIEVKKPVVEPSAVPKVSKPAGTAAKVDSKQGETKPETKTAQPTPKPAPVTPKPAAATPKPAAPKPKPAAPTPKPAAPTPKPAAPTPKPAPPTPKPTAPTATPAAPTPKSAAPTPKPASPTPASNTKKTPEVKDTEKVKVATPKVESKKAPEAVPKKSPEVKSDVKTETKKSPEVKATPSKPEVKQSPPAAKPALPKIEVIKYDNSKNKKTDNDGSKPVGTNPAPEHIPIKEDIPSDTAKPAKETLKVITRDGPSEIPNHDNV